MKLKTFIWIIIKRSLALLKLNKEVIEVALFVTILSSILFTLNVLNSMINQLLTLSTYTPWGIITSIFVHGNLEHIKGNILLLWIWTIYIVFQNSFMVNKFLREDDVSKRLKFSMISVFLSVISSNILWLILSNPGSTTIGSSGVVYAFGGVLLALSLMNFLYISRKFENKDISTKAKAWNMIWNIFVCASLSILVVFQGAIFFATGNPQINALVHLVSFLLAFIMVSVYEYYPLFLLPSIQKIIYHLKNRK